MFHAISVTVPFSLAGAPSTIQVQTAAASQDDAVEVARTLAGTMLAMRHLGQEAGLTIGRPRADPAGVAVPGLHAYVLADGPRIVRHDFSARIEPEGAQRLTEGLGAIATEGLYGVLVDCVNLTYISSLGLGAMAGNAQRLRLRLIRPNPNVLKIITLVGLDRAVPCLADLPAACAHLVAAWRQTTPGHPN